ncbi:phage tail sheath C-terminal domain-containing protein [Caballeronia sp. LZ001]|uniref:phage tail sheath C-terminal domain-containing protein n=1 Tax=Caballeronia sp. LZ001 TaxID=3038553 RepID=UPI00285A6FA3|nr:phage tail sheath C-terminal domain-containing protein [Caballeronia sp. LZ001]MDR5803403.1 phage tail sheath C-terminal domain-containing protein [Caballeronia sp. LZ001]
MASKNISFDTIPSGIRKPGKYFEYNTKLAVRTLPTNEQTVLIIGQRTASGSIPALQPVKVFSGDQAATYFGSGSLAHLAAVAAIKANPYVALTVITVDDAQEAIAAKSAIALDGKAETEGLIVAQVGNSSVTMNVRPDETGAVLMLRLCMLINKTSSLPVTAEIAAASGPDHKDSAQVTVAGQEKKQIVLSAKNKGACGNFIQVSLKGDIKGLSVATSPMMGGKIDPLMCEALAEVVGGRYDLYAVCWPSKAFLLKLREYLDLVSGPLEQRPGIGVAGISATLAEATTLASEVNAARVTLGWHPGSLCVPAEIGAAYAAAIASETDPARPLNTLPLKGLDVTPVQKQAGRQEQEAALHNGITPFEVGPGNVVQIVRSITTYTKDSQGIDDPALLDITTIRTLDYFRKACLQRVAQRFPREKLSDKTPAKVRSELLDVAYKCEELEILEHVDANKDKLIVERDMQDANQLNAAIPCDVVNGLHVFAGRIDLFL